MKKYTFLIIFTLILSACALWPAGEDPKGKRLRANATEVLNALNAYKIKNQYLPNQLNELVPVYLHQLPREPQILYSPDSGGLRFEYTQTLGWGQCACLANVGDTSFQCKLCYL